MSLIGQFDLLQVKLSGKLSSMNGASVHAVCMSALHGKTSRIAQSKHDFVRTELLKRPLK